LKISTNLAYHTYIFQFLCLLETAIHTIYEKQHNLNIVQEEKHIISHVTNTVWHT